MAPVLDPMFRTGASGELDCGIFVGADSTVSLDVTPAILAALATSGVTLRVTAYPCAFFDTPDDEAGTE